MAQPVLNPVDLRLLLPLLPAEREFARCLAEGKRCIVGDGKLPEVPIESGNESEGNANVVRGEIVRFFAYGGDSDKRFVRGPTIALQGAWILGNLNLMHANIPYALSLADCKFPASVVMPHAKCVALYLSGSHLAQGLIADGLATKGNMYLHDGFVAESEVRLPGANVGGNFACMGARFHNPKGSALHADGLTTKGSVFLSDGFVAKGEVQLLDANVGGNFACMGGQFHNPKGNALLADGLTTKGNVFLSDGFVAKGEVRLLNANIGGGLHCSGGTFINAESHALALYADGIRTQGNVNLSHKFVAVGNISLLGAQIGWDLDCYGAYFDSTLNGESANIGNVFGWHMVSGKGKVVLLRAQADGLSIDMTSPGMFQFALRDFVYGQFFDNESLQSRINWLGNWPKHEYPFSPQPYEQAAKVLFGMGQAKDAREILLEKERMQTKDERTPWHHKIGRRLWDVFAGYGYRLRYTAAWMAGFVLVGAFLFNFADDNGRMVPHQPVVLANAEYRDATNPPCAEFKCSPEKRPTELVKRLFPDYPEFNALAYSADVFIPFFALHQEPYWYPKPREMDGWFFRWFMPFWYWLEIGAGWVLTSLFLLSITGLLRPRQSSGEKG